MLVLIKLDWSQEFGISNKFPGDVDDVGQNYTLRICDQSIDLGMKLLGYSAGITQPCRQCQPTRPPGRSPKWLCRLIVPPLVNGSSALFS